MKIYNVKIKTMDSDRRVIENGWVEITDGIISAVESGSPEAVTAEDIDGNGRTVYPWFYRHSHTSWTIHKRRRHGGRGF